VLVTVASLSIAGCTSSTSSNQAASNTSQATSSAVSPSASASASAMPTPSIASAPTPTPSITPTATPTPTTVSFLALPLESVIGEPMGATFGITAQGKGINETVSFYVDGTYAGQATTSTSGTGEFIFPSSSTSGLTLGQHAFTASFAGNARYTRSTFTGHVDIGP
jgi:hypothetical protein